MWKILTGGGGRLNHDGTAKRSAYTHARTHTHKHAHGFQEESLTGFLRERRRRQEGKRLAGTPPAQPVLWL